MVFFAFNQYWATNFHSIFFAGNISVLFATWNDVSIYFVSNVTSYPTFYFSQMLMLCKKEVTILHIHGKKILHIKAIWLKFSHFLTKIFEEFNNDLHLWKSEVTTIKKDKMFNISLNVAHFSFLFLFLQSLIPTCTIQCVHLTVFLYLALNLETFFKKCDFLEKFILSLF